MPNRSDYQPLSQSADGDGDIHSNGLPAPVTSGRPRRHRPGPIDLSKLDAAFKRWTESIAHKVKGKKKVESDNSQKEILRSVFEPQVVRLPSAPSQSTKTLDHNPPMSQEDYNSIVSSVRHAIDEGIHPKMITKGSSGSYFARAKTEGRVQTVAVFKPKDEEPYGRLNPKTTKWLHRKMRWLIPFGRSCLIPNLSYISEAAASLLDERLELFIVPKTELVSFSSPAFFYDWLDLNAAKKGKPLPDKIGSMQCFMHGYQDASEFLRQHPWPGRSIADTFDDSTHRTGRLHKRFLTALKVMCGKTGDDDDLYDEDDEEERAALFDARHGDSDYSSQRFYWSGVLQQSFREELEKLVILDYIMHNTDRGADNYMIKYCEAEHEKEPVAVAPSRSASLQIPILRQNSSTPPMSTTTTTSVTQPPSVTFSPSLAPSMTATTSATSPSLAPPLIPGLQPSSTVPSSSTPPHFTRQPHIHIAAIDNSLAFPHEHPHGWRSYTYGWLYLPVSLIGPPFSEKTRNHFLPLLTSKKWWEETTYELRKLFAVDADFNLGMFKRQMAVIKGQAWNVVQSLKHHDEGPLELTRRQKVLVWDDEVEVADDEVAEIFNGPLSASPKPSVMTLPPQLPSHRRTRSHSGSEATKKQIRGSSGFPPAQIRRSSSSASESDATRPVPFASKMPRVHPGTRGVTVLEHMERVDAVEAGLRRLVVPDPEDNVIPEEDEPEEVDVGLPSSLTPSSSRPSTIRAANTAENSSALEDSLILSSPLLSPSNSGDAAGDITHLSLPVGGLHSMESSMTEEDLVAMSKSMSVLDPAPQPLHMRWNSNENPASTNGAVNDVGISSHNLEWMHGDASEARKRIVINERLEEVNTKPFFSCW